MTNVVALNRIKCPIGAFAIHEDFGWCRVVAADGLRRTVEVVRSVVEAAPSLENLPIGVEPHEILTSEIIAVTEHDVPVQTLRELNPQRDLRPGAPSRIHVFRRGAETPREVG